MRGAKMHFRKSPQRLRTFLLDQLARGFFHARRNSATEHEPEPFAGPRQPINERFTREDGSGRDCKVGFGAGALVELNPPALLQERILDYPDIGKLVRQGARTIRPLGEQILDDAGVAPAEQAVEVAEFSIKLVVTLRADEHDIEGHARGLANQFRQRPDPRVRADAFAVLDSVFQKMPRDRAIGEHAGDDKWTEEVAFAALINPEMWREHFRRMHFLVAESRFPENLRLQLKTDELINPFTLQEQLRSFLVDGGAELVFLREENGVGLGRKSETALGEQLPQRPHLVVAQRNRITAAGGCRHERVHENIARPGKREFFLRGASPTVRPSLSVVARRRSIRSYPGLDPAALTTPAAREVRKKCRAFAKQRRDEGATAPQIRAMKKPAIRNILVPIDFSPLSLKSIAQARKIARHFEATIHLLHVSSPQYPIDFIGPVLTGGQAAESFDRHQEKSSAEQLQAVAERAGLPAETPVHVREGGSVFHEICHFAQASAIDLIVMPTHGRTGLKHVLLGSTAERVVQHATCPVFITRPRQSRKTKSGGEKLSRKPIILVPIDFSPASLEALQYAIAFAADTGASLLVLHAIQSHDELSNEGLGVYRLADFRTTAQRDAEREMRQFLSQVDFASVPFLLLVRFGKPAPEICNIATRRAVDLIIAGTHGRTGLKHLVIGSVAEHVVREAMQPVLVVPSHPQVRLAGLERLGAPGHAAPPLQTIAVPA